MARWPLPRATSGTDDGVDGCRRFARHSVVRRRPSPCGFARTLSPKRARIRNRRPGSSCSRVRISAARGSTPRRSCGRAPSPTSTADVLVLAVHVREPHGYARAARRSLRPRDRRRSFRCRSTAPMPIGRTPWGIDGRGLRRPAGRPALRSARVRLARGGTRRADRRGRARRSASRTSSVATTARSPTKRSGPTSRSHPRAGSTSRLAPRTTSLARHRRRARSRRPRARPTGASRSSRPSARRRDSSPRRRSSPCSATFPRRRSATTVRWRAAPRLDLLASGAGQSVGGELGGNAWMRASLRLDDRGDGSLGLELRRQDVSTRAMDAACARSPRIAPRPRLSLLVGDRGRRPRPARTAAGSPGPGGSWRSRGARATAGRSRARSRRRRRPSTATRPTPSCALSRTLERPDEEAARRC